MTNIESMRNLRCIKKRYDHIIREVCVKYDIGRPELDIISFLNCNSDLDVASDIVEHCVLSKANVSQAVERLIQKQLLIRVPDVNDRRRIHLTLTDSSRPIVSDIDKAYETFRSVLISGIPESKLAVYCEVSMRMAENAKEYLNEK